MPSSHCREDEVEWGGDTKCESEGEDGFVGFVMSALCHCVHKAEDKGEGRSTSMGWRSWRYGATSVVWRGCGVN